MLVAQIQEVLEKYQSLKVNEDFSIISGTLNVIDKNRILWDSYQIEIHINRNFPHRFPLLFEVGGKIPKSVRWHIYSDSGSCCLTVPQKEIIACRRGITLIKYLDDWVIPYLANQTFRFHTGLYVNDEYAHNKLLATVEFYQDLFNVKNIRQIILFIVWITKNPKPNRTALCFCGSKTKFRNCHREAYESVLLLGNDTLFEDFTLLLTFLTPSPAPSSKNLA
jgi:hypothetical protein